MWPDDRFQRLAGIDLPIIQAPMAGASTFEMALAVSGAGGLGSIACATLSAAALHDRLTRVKESSAAAFNVNFFAHAEPGSRVSGDRKWLGRLSRYYEETGAPMPTTLTAGPIRPFDEEHCAVLEAMKPAIVSFHFGLPVQNLVERLKSAGIAVISSATTVAEAVWLGERGCDAVIAQGTEAGGHRGTFLEDDPHGQMGLFSLVPQIADAVEVPVIAAGGIADGRGLAAAFALGAAAVQIGTAFLFTSEAALDPLAARVLRSQSSKRTAITNIFSGRPARCIVNRAVEEIGPNADDLPDFPLGFAAMTPLRVAAEAQGDWGFSARYCGQAAALCQSTSAATLTQRIGHEGAELCRGQAGPANLSTSQSRGVPS
jgi:nitronate monooxygenase